MQLVEAINSNSAPQAIGPYSQAVRAGNFIFCSGQLGLDRTSGKLVSDDAAVQAETCLKNLEAVLKAAGSSLRNIVKTTIFLTNLQDFEKVNTAYGGFFGETKPARSTVQVAALPRGARVEIEAIAINSP